MSEMPPNGNGRIDIVPPGCENFVDIRAIFEDGAKEIKEGELITISGFDLNDAMAALEIMDPRMDSGLLPEAPPFDPNMLLLPEEVCWILDRTFASEVGWHNGLALSQTVLTIRYVHYLADIGLSRFKISDATHSHPYSPTSSKLDPNRPPELVNLVLRAGIFGLMKCCDLVWRELSQNRVLEGEDWNSDKFNVSLCENIQPEKVINLLGDALIWLRQTPAISNAWRSALTDRILLRKNILQMLSSPSTIVLQNARQDLAAILSTATTPNPSPQIINAIDLNITRHLISSIPIRNIPQLSQKEVWAAWKTWVEQWEESRSVINAGKLWSVKLLAEMRVYENKPQGRTAFLRSVASSTFFNGAKILLIHEPPWVVDRFFYETAAIPPGLLPDTTHQLTDTLLRSFNNIDTNTDQHLTDDLTKELTEGVDNFEKTIASLLVDFFTSFYHNRARQRRIFAGSLLEWHLAYEQAVWITSYLKSNEPFEAYSRIPLCIRYTRLMIISQVILSGFELELYAQFEWAMMYWYLAEVLSVQSTVLNEIHSSLLQETTTPDIEQAIEFVTGQRNYVHGLQGISLALRDILFHTVSRPVQLDAELEQAKFRIRFKWAFVKGYSVAQGPDQDRPILGKWRRWCMLNESRVDWQASAVEALNNSSGIFSRLAASASKLSTATFCVDEYQQFLTTLGQICHANAQILVKVPVIAHNVQIRCLWARSKWFPVLDHPSDSDGYSFQ